MTQQTREKTRAIKRKLTFYADDLGPVPLSVRATLGGGHVALQEAVGALVARHRVDVVVGALPTNQEGVVHGRRGSTQHWRGDEGRRGGTQREGRTPTISWWRSRRLHSSVIYSCSLTESSDWSETGGSAKFVIDSLTATC